MRAGGPAPVPDTLDRQKTLGTNCDPGRQTLGLRLGQTAAPRGPQA